MRQRNRRSVILAATAMLAAMLSRPRSAAAQSYPLRPVRIIVP
jgi:tripartite-type tricarboxylate transporter receptor subunit TctC